MENLMSEDMKMGFDGLFSSAFSILYEHIQHDHQSNGHEQKEQNKKLLKLYIAQKHRKH